MDLKFQEEVLQSSPFKILMAFLSGNIFGFALEKGRVFLPQVILNQMLLRDFTMMKMFLGAGTSSLLLFSLLSFTSFHKLFDNIRKFESHNGITATIVGAALLGVGMALCGACPGTVFPQVSTGIISGFLVLVGGLAGAFTHGFLMDTNANYRQFITHNTIPGLAIMSDYRFKIPFHIAATGLAAAFTLFLLFLEYMFPYQSSPSSSNLFAQFSWHPVASGFVVGIANLLLALSLHQTMGSATSFAVVLGHFFHWNHSKLESTFPHFQKVRMGSLWWQPIFLLGAVVGSFLSSQLSGSDSWGKPSHITLGLGVFRSLIGGFFIVFGARCAGGCTSGHGIAGMSQLFIDSILAVPAMFAGGITTAFLLQSLSLN